MDQLEGKYDSLKTFLQDRVIPTIVKLQNSFPDLLEGGNPTNNTRNQNNGTSDGATQNRLLAFTAAAATTTTTTGSGERRAP
jgi:hypothetical protein